ncbi:MAG: YggS family pyridoxal phosphate-dependent enzyme [Alphaproteobacteria bacterium]
MPEGLSITAPMAAPNQEQIKSHLEDVEAKIASAAKNVGRVPSEITLIAVSKTHPAETIEAALRAGHRHFGENRVQEAQSKWPELKSAYPDAVLHLIGGLQSNKARDAVALFDVIHSIDRPRIARAVARHAAELERKLTCFVQVNTGEEPQKGGVLPADVDDLVRICRDEVGLTLQGLMCIPPSDEAASLHFALLRKFAERNGVLGLSMGMSGDYPLAVEMGATHVRVGTAIFGARQPLR